MPTANYTKCLVNPERAMTIIKPYRCIEEALLYVDLPYTKFAQCRKLYEPSLELVKGIRSLYSETDILPNKTVWITSKEILIHMGLNLLAVDIMDRYYS